MGLLPGWPGLFTASFGRVKVNAQGQGPFEFIKQEGPVDDEIKMTGRRKETKIYHVNLLKP